MMPSFFFYKFFCSWQPASTLSLMSWGTQILGFQMAALFLPCLTLSLRVSYTLFAMLIPFLWWFLWFTIERCDFIVYLYLSLFELSSPNVNTFGYHETYFYCHNSSHLHLFCFLSSFSVASHASDVFSNPLWQSFQAYHLTPSTNSFQSMLVSRTYSWLCTLSTTITTVLFVA